MTFSDRFSSYTAYFDRTGVVAAATRFNDYPSYCGGRSNDASYGDQPDCAIEVTKDLCLPRR